MSANSTETMTSAERFAAAVSGGPHRVPVHLLISDHAARVLGVTVGETNLRQSSWPEGKLWRSGNTGTTC